MMNVKHYLSQVYYLDMLINAKIEALAKLNSLATKATATLSDMPHSPNRGTSSFEETICKIVDLQEEINADIDHLVDLKRDIERAINQIPDIECKIVLTKRYLCFMSWAKIADDTNFSTDNVYRIHRKALDLIEIPENYKV